MVDVTVPNKISLQWLTVSLPSSDVNAALALAKASPKTNSCMQGGRTNGLAPTFAPANAPAPQLDLFQPTIVELVGGDVAPDDPNLEGLRVITEKVEVFTLADASNYLVSQ